MLLSHDALIAALFCETDRAQRMKTPLSLVYFGIDEGEELQLRLGAAVFARALSELVVRISRILRCYDSFSQISDSEFVILLPGCVGRNAVGFAGRLKSVEFGLPVLTDGVEIRFSGCFGVTESGGRSPLVVLREAQETYRRARNRGGSAIESSRSLEADPVLFLGKTG